MGAETVHANELRRLEFVKSTSESVLGNSFKIAHGLYSNLRTRIPLPGQLDAQIKTVESKVTEFTAPRLNQLQDVSGDWLTYADGKVALRSRFLARLCNPFRPALAQSFELYDTRSTDRRPMSRWINW